MADKLTYEFGSQTVSNLINLQDKGQLNLEPAFQRDSVWNKTDRRKLIQSIFDGYPIPSIFLYRREENGFPVYDVLDGKQRLETIFMFARASGFKQTYFDADNKESVVKYIFPGDEEEAEWWDWNLLKRKARTASFLSYKIQTTEVSGELADITELFVRINSTGKPLTTGEKMHARYYKSPFMRNAKALARKFRWYFADEAIISPVQFERMKDVELVSELLVSLANGGPINKKVAIDKAISGGGINANTLGRVWDEFVRTIGLLRKVFPKLYSTRFRNISEFYSLFMLVHEWDQQKLVLTDKSRNTLAQKLLTSFSDGVDHVRELQKKTRGAGPEQQMFASYLLSTQQGTDSLSQRKHRAEIIRGVFASLFGKKDDLRNFSPEQRRLLWNSDTTRHCKMCKKALVWGDFHIDHWKPHSRGGSTTLDNAKLLCVKCNIGKGAKQMQLA